MRGPIIADVCEMAGRIAAVASIDAEVEGTGATSVVWQASRELDAAYERRLATASP